MRHKLLICSCGGDGDVGDDGDGDDDDLPMYSVHPWCSFHVLHCDRFALSENTTLYFGQHNLPPPLPQCPHVGTHAGGLGRVSIIIISSSFDFLDFQYPYFYVNSCCHDSQ